MNDPLNKLQKELKALGQAEEKKEFLSREIVPTPSLSLGNGVFAGLGEYIRHAILSDDPEYGCTRTHS